MKKFMLILLCGLILCGCNAAGTFETVDDDLVQPVMQQANTFQVAVEAGAVEVTGEEGTIYLCDGYEVTLQVMLSGNLDATLQKLTGFSSEELTVMETVAEDMRRLECVWSSAGENGDMVGRAVIFDDGIHHYCITVLSDARDAQALRPVWNAIVDSVTFA